MTRPSLERQYFDHLYEQSDDPWKFETSEYEHAKYAATVKALPRTNYLSGLEVGCSVGVLTKMLAPLCTGLLSVDASALPLGKARERLKDHPHVTIEQMQIPQTLPGQTFDLIVLSEVAYYWSEDDLAVLQGYISKALLPGGHLLMVHWTPEVEDYPMGGDEVHEAFHHFAQATHTLKHLQHQQHDQYRLDLWEAFPPSDMQS